MADAEDKEKAEKLAAAKKRFEQLKKQQKKGKKGAKSKEEKSEDAAAKEEKEEAAAPAEPTEASEAPEATPETTADIVASPTEEEPPTSTSPSPSSQRPGHARKESQSAQSRQRSESFRQASISSPAQLKSPGLPSISAEDEVQDIYRKQHARIEELEKDNKALKGAELEHMTKLQKADEEIEKLRESNAEIAEFKSRAAVADEKTKEVEKLNAEVTSLQRQCTQAQQAANEKRRKSNASPSREVQEQLSQKTSTIESLELELSNLRNQYHISQSTNEASQVTITELEQRVQSAEAASEAAKQEVETLKDSLSKTAEESKDKTPDEDPAALQQRIAVLESDLRTAQNSATEAAQRATSLEQKIDALTKLHKDATATSSSQEKELSELKSNITSLQTKKSPKPDDAEESLSDLEDEEREKMVNRIRELEAENFDLKRGIWRETRQALQPGLEDDGGATSPGYEDIDLNGSNPYASVTAAAARAGMPGRQGSSFQDVLQSGISAFTGKDRRMSVTGEKSSGRSRGQSLGLLSEDGFDEDAFREAQEEEGKRRIERIKEVKRGLDQWRGWRVDLVDMRQGGLGGNAWTGPVFDV
ncbi:hypothetical protein AAFC00_004810 [Neodothiora populina]|uniref:M protein repeat protein n=1 Tax=Neodothiora populina TaxID=2781224 RepID=A0ABR3P3J6_9PEZI